MGMPFRIRRAGSRRHRNGLPGNSIGCSSARESELSDMPALRFCNRAAATDRQTRSRPVAALLSCTRVEYSSRAQTAADTDRSTSPPAKANKLLRKRRHCKILRFRSTQLYLLAVVVSNNPGERNQDSCGRPPGHARTGEIPGTHRACSGWKPWMKNRLRH
jgi:hypothetical protein